MSPSPRYFILFRWLTLMRWVSSSQTIGQGRIFRAKRELVADPEMTSSLTRILVIRDVKEVTCNFTGARVKVQGQNWAQNCSGGFIIAQGSFRPRSQYLRHIWDWVDGSHQSTCILQRWDSESLLCVIGDSNYTILFCRIMVILGTFLFPLSKFRDSKDNHQQRITNENDVASYTKTLCSGNEEDYQDVH